MALGCLAFQQKATNAYSGLDFNFDLPSDEEAEESYSANYSQEPGTPTEADFPLPRLFCLLTPKSLYSSLPDRPCLLYFSSRVYLFFFVGPGA